MTAISLYICFINCTSQAMLGCLNFLSSCIPLKGTHCLKELWIYHQKSLHKCFHMCLITSMSLNVKQHLKSVVKIWNPEMQRCTCITGNTFRTSGYLIYSFTKPTEQFMSLRGQKAEDHELPFSMEPNLFWAINLLQTTFIILYKCSTILIT